MDKLKGMNGLIKIADFLNSLDIDTSKLTMAEAVKIQIDIIELLEKNTAIIDKKN